MRLLHVPGIRRRFTPDGETHIMRLYTMRVVFDVCAAVRFLNHAVE